MQSEEMAAEVERMPEADNKSFTTRLWELPVALAAVNQLSEIYSAVKERNCVTRMACNAGEKTIDMANSASKPIIQAASTCSLSKPIVGTVECAAATIDRVASGTLAIVEEKCPIITKTPTEIKTSVTDTASEYYDKVQKSCMVKMLVSKTEQALDFGELITELALPTDGYCGEDMNDLQLEFDDSNKGVVSRAYKLKKRLTRRGKRKLLSYKPVQMSVDACSSVQGCTSELLEMSTDAGKKVFKATMYIPNMALGLTGDVIVSAKELVFSLTKAHPVQEMPATVTGLMTRAVQPICDAKDKLSGYLFVPPHVMTGYLLTSRPVQWIIPHIVAVEDLQKMQIVVGENEDSAESEEYENEKDSS
ncbi:uncharacterized protein LOC111338980 [Stylophora pistillata]|uniref:Uncharacterized protein n=1 Tax=Stylophora pistillata TaxID=50429 RepID=A0A2B4SW38_STYPI|nr:uncharacterized protein LOC111338980 [Stylophora pistillata]PFX34894.1 hypothetical protein AWC38_SpisGene132 [Stylophora pistillata]